MANSMVSVRLDPDVVSDLRDIANQRGTSVSDLLRQGAVMAMNERNVMTIEWLTPPTVTLLRQPGAEIAIALNAFPEDDKRHWLVQAYLFNLLAHKAQTKADTIHRNQSTATLPADGPDQQKETK